MNIKTKRWLMWSSISLVSVVILLAGFIALFFSWLPEKPNQNSLVKSQPSDLVYLNHAIKENRGKILIVVTSTDQMGDSGKSTGYELTEVARPYYIFRANGFKVDIASPRGGEPPVVIDKDDMGIFDYSFLNDSIAQSKIVNSIRTDQIDESAYEAVFFAGGKGALFDFPFDKHIQKFVREMDEKEKVIGAVCHGPAALTHVNLADGSPLIAGKTVCGFTNEEELFLIPEAKTIFPFLLQSEMEKKGADFQAGATYLQNVQRDGRLITGQNPWSTWKAAEMMVTTLGYTPVERTPTGEEGAIEVLNVLHQYGYKNAKNKMRAWISDEKKPFDRTLIAMHGIVALMRGEVLKMVNLLRLLQNADKLDSAFNQSE